MKNPSRIQKHPHQEDKTGGPSYASKTKINSSTNDPRSENDQNIPEGHKFKFIRVHPRKNKKRGQTGTLIKGDRDQRF